MSLKEKNQKLIKKICAINIDSRIHTNALYMNLHSTLGMCGSSSFLLKMEFSFCVFSYINKKFLEQFTRRYDVLNFKNLISR